MQWLARLPHSRSTFWLNRQRPHDATQDEPAPLDHRAPSAYLVLAEGIHLFMQMKGWV